MLLPLYLYLPMNARQYTVSSSADSVQIHLAVGFTIWPLIIAPPLYPICLATGHVLSSNDGERQLGALLPLQRQRFLLVTSRAPSIEARIPPGPPVFFASMAMTSVVRGMLNCYNDKTSKRHSY